MKVSLSPTRIKGLAVLLVVTGALVASVSASSPQGFPACLFHHVTGIPCASCGMTRAFLDLGHGRFLSAIQHNLASPLVFLTACGLFVAAVLQVFQDEERMTQAWRKIKGVALPVLIGTLGIGWIWRLWMTFGHRI